jgi:hypothetical protein
MPMRMGHTSLPETLDVLCHRKRGLRHLIPHLEPWSKPKIRHTRGGMESRQTIPYQLREIKTFSRLNPYFFMSFPSRIYASHACVVGHSIYREHVGRRPGVYRMRIRVPADVIEACHH